MGYCPQKENDVSIRRIGISEPSETSPARARAVVCEPYIYIGAVAPMESSGPVFQQTQDVLAQVDELLAAAGGNKHCIVRVEITLSDMNDFAEMNRAWNAWVDPEKPPGRACLSAEMANAGARVEMSVVGTMAEMI
jgi:enamine deaminase RidA (YjgF/YER057c/UK114 family)